MKSLLKRLVETDGPPGYETEVRKLVRREIEPYADEIRVDGLGSLIARKGAAGPNGRRVLLMAHMDEPGLIAAHVNGSGLVRFMPLGNLQPVVCAGQRVRFLNGAEGVVGYPAAGEVKKPSNLEQLFVDPGTGAGIAVGDVAVFAGPFLEMGDCVAGKALDDRVGVAVLIECLRRLSQQSKSPHELFFAFTTQEQPGQRGAAAAAFGVQPDILLAIDVCDAGDTPGASDPGTALRLGQGPAIRVRDQMMLSRPAVVDWMTNAAGAAQIPYQKEISTAATSGASAAQTSGEGAAAGALAIACRYRGSPTEVVHWSDVEHLTDLLTQLLTGPVSL